jgi:two-component system, cell cycle sensor histidine kinase and response regulator CckA
MGSGNAGDTSWVAEREMLLEREARLRAIVDVAFDGIVISENGVVVEITDVVLERSGYHRDEVIGQPIIEFVAEEYRDMVRQRQSAATEGHFDAVAILRNGERRRVEVITRNHETRGRTVRLVALRDVTHIRRLEQRLQQAQKMEALGLLASGVAHDFNSVLQVIGGFADLLVDEVSEQQREDLREIIKAADTGAGLVRQLLAFSRQEPDRAGVADLNDVVRATEGMLRRLLRTNIALVSDMGSGVGRVRLDAMHLEQVILNLAINARDAMPHGGTLTLRTRAVTVSEAELLDHAAGHAGEYAVLEVRDTGAGMSREIQARIFEPFFTTKEEGKGTGLGLAIVQQIVQRSGGFVTVESTEGAGSTFAVHLPQA